MADTEDMVERVARVLAENGYVTMNSLAFTEEQPSDTETIRKCRGSDTRNALAAARLAIEAMREPTEAMVLRGADARILNYDGSDTREVWQLMIDAALTDATPQKPENPA